ncbi:hypothetical protein KKB43_01890 [Patescibacteria group bacterium]|nr:hypothetical protein [Patescibacteria group bacterium]
MNLKFLSSEKFFIISIASLAMLFNLLPYVYQYKIAPPDKVYIGSYPIIYDKPTYLAEMAQGEEGKWKMINMYTTEPQKPVFLYPLYLALGHIARITQISVENIFLISRFFFGTILLFVVLYFIRYFTPGENQRKIAYFLALFASGVGWIFRHIQSLDLGAIPDAAPMVRFSYFPHFSVSHILFLGTIALFYHSLKTKNGRFFAILAGMLSFMLNFILPFTSILLYFLIISLLVIFFINGKTLLKNKIKNALIFFALSLPSLFFMYYIGTSDPVWTIVEKQNILPSPPLVRIITGYGLPLFFSILGLWALIKKDRLVGLFFSVWIFGVIALSYIPLWVYPMQRRFLETAFYVPLAITASFGIKAIYDYFKKKNVKFLRLKFTFVFSMFAIPFMIGSNIQNWQIFTYFINETGKPTYYLPKENIEAMKWLKQNTPNNGIILASFHNSNVIPCFANRMVYAGHGPMTINYAEKLIEVENFYSGKYSPDEAFNFLKNKKISYVFYSETEKKSEDGKQLDYFNPEDYSFLKNVYQNKDASIYKFE